MIRFLSIIPLRSGPLSLSSQAEGSYSGNYVGPGNYSVNFAASLSAAEPACQAILPGQR